METMSTMGTIGMFAILCLFGACTGLVAHGKGYSWGWGFFWGFIGHFLALFVCCCLPTLTESRKKRGIEQLEELEQEKQKRQKRIAAGLVPKSERSYESYYEDRGLKP